MDSSDEEWDLSGEEMDPEDEEPELPSAVQELIQKLEDKAKPLRRLLRLSSPDLQEFFPEHASLSTIIGWRRKVRLRVLEAFGSCNTFHSLDVDIVFGGDISRLLGWEWEILLRGFRSSTILRAIRVRELRWNSPEEVESLCKELGEILKNSSVEVLTIVNCRLSATCFLNLESGLRESDKSKLESLELHNAWKPGYSDAVHQVVHMINSATRLETLEIGRSGGDMYNMDENDKKILSQALIKNSSLKKLVLNEVKGQASAFLLRAFDARYGNEAIECLHLTFMSGLGDCLGELLRSNPYLKEVTLTAIDLLPEKWHQLGKAISENATARTIRVIHSMDYKDSFTEKGVEDFACGASFDVKVPTVELIITFKNYDALMSALDFVGRVLRGNIKSLESLILILECSCPSGSNHDIKKSKVPMDGNPGETSVLKRLKLFVKSRDTLKGVWKYLLCCLRENTSVTHLDLCNSGLDDEAFRELMGMLQVNLTLQQIDVSRTAWANEGKSAKIEELLKQNQERAAYMSVFREAELTFGDAKAGQLFLCGSPRAGKTRLRRTLMKIIQSSSKVRNFSTKCVEKFVRKSERISDSMQISIWDFVTPQHEIFPQTSNFCIFQFVYSPFCQSESSIKPDNCFLEELKKCIRFITSHTRYSPPQVLVVMSHKDKVKDKSFTWANTIVEEVTNNFANVVKLNQEWFHVDARKRKQVLPVKDHIFNILKVFLTENSPRVPHLCSKLTSCLVTQTKKKKCPVWSSKEFHDFCDPILRKFNPTPSVDHSRIIRSIISYMNDVGSIIYIPNVEYIIVDPNWLTNTLLSDLGQHFQAQKTESFDGSSCDTSKDGYVSESVFVRWTEEFLRKQPHGQKGVNREMLENILINLLLCDKLEDTSEYFLACFIPENPSMEKQRPEEGKAEEEDGKDEDGEGENEKEDGEVEDEEDASSSSSSCDEDGEDSFQCIITSFDSKRASMEEQKHKEGAHESMYGQNMDDTSQVVGIRIQSQNEDGEDDGKDEEDDEKDGEGDEKDGEGEDDGKDGEGDGKDGEGDEKDGEGEDDGKGEDEGEDEHGVEGEDEEEDGKDEDEEGGGEDEDDESIYFSCEEDEDGECGGKNEEDTSIFFFCEEDESIFFSCEEDDGERENEEGKDEEEDGEDTSQHVIPSFDSKRASMEKQKHEERGHQSMDWYNRDDNSQFVGIRIQCQDERTMSLTAAFFLRFQMFMRRKLISEIDVSKESVTCSRQYLRLFLDGHQIYVQQGRNHEYVDVLMLCSKRKKELARRYMMKHIVGELISFCASTNGCPGVALVLGVIQTLCVEMLNPSHLREAILIEKLKSDFIRSINDKLEEMTLENSHLVKKEELFNYEHRWAPYESGISERARDLLWQSDVEAVVNCIRQKQIQKLESLQEGLNSVDSDLAQSSWLSQASTMKDYKPSTSKWLSQESTSVENRSTGIVLRLDIHILDMEMQRLEMKEMKIGETLSLQRLEMMEMKMEQILSLQREYLLQQELQTKHSEMTTAMLSAINSEVDKRPRGKNSSYLTREQTIKPAGVSIVSDDAAELATRGMDSEDEEPGLLPSEVDKRPRGKNSSYLTREQTIKAAGVSIVSDDAAELATRGMDSEDEEPGLLPSEVDKRPRGKNSSYLTREQTIKAADVSIVSDDAAELATRGMDSEDEEPGLLPSEVDKRPRGKNSSYLTREQTIKAADVSIVSDDAAELATRGMDSEDEEPGLLPSEVDKRPRGKNSSYLTREQTIKAADVSIVSDDAAELATRGMDSEDEEPGLLPSEVDKRPRGKNSSYLTREQTIKAADVSIVSDDAAELATRGMDSEDEEPGLLPSAAKDLIWRLEGRAQPLPWLSTLSSPEFQEFFPEPASLSTIKGWRGEVRLRVLEAIGSCNTFHSLDVQDIFGGDISRLTASEWELLLRGFRRSTVLRAIRVEGLRWSSLAEVENLCLQLGRILNASSVKDLRIVNCRLNARCFLNLASGLRSISKSELESLELRDAWEDSSAVKHMADMIIGATRLETLEIGGSGGRLYDMDEEATRTLSQALMRSWSLKKLVLKEVKDEASAFLLKALNADDGNRTIECLHLISVSGLGDCLGELLRSNPCLKEVTLTAFDMRPEEGRQLGEAIRENATARTIRVTHSIRHKDDFKGVEELACAASSTNKDPRMEMIITFYDYNAYMSALNFVVRVLRGNIKSVESLILILECSCPSGSNQDRMESIVPMDGNLGETSVLKRLRLYVDSKDNLKGVWKYLLCCLRENTSVTHLDLCNSGLDDEAFKELMGVLQVNLTLKQIDVSGTSWAIDGKATLIQMALEQNQKRGVYMAVFREARLAFGDAKAGRIFLCGSTLAGKTQLLQTLMRIVQGKARLGNKFAELFKFIPTTGIEVKFLQNNKDRQISIWDVPGQENFRTLQNVLFPRTSNFSLFLFVYSTFCEKTFSSKPDHCLQSELEDWLNLITSCTRVTGHNLPQVLVVISHKDKATSTSLSWAHDRMEYLTKRFANFVDVLPIQECSYIDARNKNQVVPLKNHIFHIFEKLLSEKSPRVPKLCFQLSSLLVTNTKEHITCPIWTYQRFCDFCAPSLKKLIPSSSAHSVDHSSIIRSIILYLNEVGSIVHIPNLDYIIVNPNWLTNTFLGKVIGLDQKSNRSLIFSSDRNRSYTSTNGFVSESIFARLIEEFLKKQPHVEKIVDRHVLENILINLDLCFKLEDSSQYFIPSFIPEGSAVESMAWQTRVKSSQFVGIRIQCQDARTMSFTAGFFPCFQMFMRSKLISEMHVPKEIVTCSRHYLCTILDGHEIYVEQGTSYKYVDVLMLCSKYKSRKTALKYVMKHIIQELISFCASPKGCSEVALERGVIQTLCVERLIPSHLRQAILVETLKSDFIHSINDKLEEMPLGSLHLTEEELLSYEHFWPLIEGHISEYTSERATELLCESDVEAVVNEIRQKQMQRLESLQKGLFSVENDLAQFCKPSTSRRLSGSSKSVENRSTQLISFELDQIRGGLDEILRSSASIELRDGMEMTRGQILSRHQQLQSTLSAFISKVDRIIEYSTALVNTRTPKRPYVTNDVGLFYKMSAHLDNGTIIRLHFMCESVSGFHTVEDQEGLRIRLDSENRSWIQKIIEISYKVIYYAVKSGLHKTYNLGQAIPDGEDLEPAIVTLDGIDHREFRTGGESKELQEAWLRIQQILAPELENRYSKIFNLYQVKYLNLEVAGHAWVCEKCLNKGLRSGSLEV